MAQLHDLDLGELAYEAGWRGGDIAVAVAIALAESGGRTDIVNTAGNHPQNSRDRGLWQINDYWHPEVTDVQAFSPEGNAQAAHRIYLREGWTAWSTFTLCRYLDWLGRGQVAARVTLPGVFELHRSLALVSPYLYGVDVSAVQFRLKSGLMLDGVYGPVTAAAVASVQHQHDVTADGVVGPVTAPLLGLSFHRLT